MNKIFDSDEGLAISYVKDTGRSSRIFDCAKLARTNIIESICSLASCVEEIMVKMKNVNKIENL